MDQIYLTFRENRFLFILRFRKKAKPRFDVSHLYDCNLIKMNYYAEKNQYGASMPDGTFSLTDFAIRYRIAKRQARWHRLVTPITVSILTNAALYALKWLLQQIGQWL